MKIGILETGASPLYVCETYGDSPRRIAAYFSAFEGLHFARYPIYQTGVAPDPQDADAWIIPGSARGAYEDLSWIRVLIQFTQQLSGRAIPLLGICFGHHVMALAYGGQVVKSEKGRGIGLHAYEVTDPGKKIFPGQDRLHLMAAHQDQIVVLPPEAKILASSSFCPYAALAYGKHALSLQPHPEFTRDYERYSILQWQKESPVSEAAVNEALLSLERRPSDSPQIAPALARFLKGQLEL